MATSSLIRTIVPIPQLPAIAERCLTTAYAAVRRDLTNESANDLMQDLTSEANRAWFLLKKNRTRENAAQTADTNARAAAALSADTDFPHAAPVSALIYVANTLGALGDISQEDGDHETAVTLFLTAMALAKRYRAVTHVKNVDQAIFSLAARLARSAGAVAAMKGLSVSGFLETFDANVTRPYETTMPEGDLSGPRAFAVIEQLREATKLTESEDSKHYLKKLRAEILQRLTNLLPKSKDAAFLFRIQLEDELEKAAVRLGEMPTAKFAW